MFATCATIATVLAAARGGENIQLPRQSCSAIVIKRQYKPPITIVADGSVIRGLVITGGGVRWQSGVITAAGGVRGTGPDGYAALLRGASNVRLDGVVFTDADRGIVVDKAQHIAIINSRFLKLGSDGIIGSATEHLLVKGNVFAETNPVPTRCSVEAQIVFNLSRRDCLARGGAWKDGSHADAVQLRNAVKDAVISHNLIYGETQGLTQMDTTGDLPLERVVIERNTIETNGPHKITLGDCISCVVRWNTLSRTKGSAWKAVIIPGRSLTCGNKSERKEAAC